ncbi:protein FAM161A isoform X2 [Dunckerocampus dactyliophorus]|uniref:protein FAM161A isoform X2 n=1 Tax=Dunckerocampus dactyliophorus TaxID=161453 RepID=UPI002404C14E|nr:protein FAM161A isoform X2 [Dunckerocampus dactyliophorus]
MATKSTNNSKVGQAEYEDIGSDLCDGDCPRRMKDNKAGAAERMDLREIFFSNEEYYSKLEELKKAHLRTMAELESMYHHKLQRHAKDPLAGETGQSALASRRLRKSHSAMELRRGSGPSESSDEDGCSDVEKGLLFSPKEYIKNMWKDFKLSPRIRHLSSSLPGGHSNFQPQKEKRQSHRVTVPKPFRMTLREAERQKRGVKTRAEIELENAELRRQLEELTECQNKFRASPVPAHVHLPLYEELKERNEERRRTMREREEHHLRSLSKPFSFLERERLKKEQRQQQQQPSEQDRVKPFKAKPVPKSVYAAASGELRKEEQLYRSIQKQMRAQEMLHSSSRAPNMLDRRLCESKKSKGSGKDGSKHGNPAFSHRPHINKEVPDFNASYKRFQKTMERRKEVKPTTSCEPFDLRTSQISSHRQRIIADMEKEQSSSCSLRWPYISSPKNVRTPNSSLCSSLSGSMELLPAKITDATKKRHEAVRQVLEQRRRAEQEEEHWKERQKEREKKLQKLVQKRAHANDPHLALSQTHNSKLKEFRKQDRQRRKEYQQEIKEIKERVKGRPLLLEQVAQKNAKQAAEKHFSDTLHGCHLTEEFISRKAVMSRSPQADDTCELPESEGIALEPVLYTKVSLDDEDQEVESEEKASCHGSEDKDVHQSCESCDYSDDHDNYSDDSEQDAEDTDSGKQDEDEQHP